MNQYHLQFYDKILEKKYFDDQIPQLIEFFKWICIIGSTSSISIFIMEYINPLGLGKIRFSLLGIPLIFYLSFKTIKKHPQYFNFVLCLLNFIIGLMVNILSALYVDSEILFLAGQTVAMVQFSLFIGTNFLANIIILSVNQLGLIMINSITFNYLKANQIMFFFAVLLVIKSIYIQNKTKRQFFLTKNLNQSLFNSLATGFELGIANCRYDSRQCSIQLINNNNKVQKLFLNQEQFIKFIREYKQIPNLSQSYFLQKKNAKLDITKEISLELLLFEEFKKSKIVNQNYYIYSQKEENSFNICLLSTYQNKQKEIIIIFQKDLQLKKILKLQQQLKTQISINDQFVQINIFSRKALGILKCLSKNLNQSSIKEAINQPLYYLSYMTQCYYNIIIQNDYLRLGIIKKFNLMQLCQDLKLSLSVLMTKRKSNIHFLYNINQQLATNYLLFYQLLTNLIIEHIQEYTQISISFYEITILDQKCIKITMTFLYDIRQQEINTQINQDNHSNDILHKNKQVNLKIMQQIGINHQLKRKEIVKKTKSSKEEMQIQFTIIQNLDQFHLQI